MIEHINNHSDWIEKRKYGIGGSDAAAVLGASPYKTNAELWREKTGQTLPPDISDKPCVIYGKGAEKHIRALYELENPQYSVEYSEFDIHRNDINPFIYATLDGILTERATNRKGVLEIKTSEIRRKGDWHKWDNQIPQNYYIQILHQLIATGFEFAVVVARLKYCTQASQYPQYVTKEYRLERSEEQVIIDIDVLKAAEIKFWNFVEQKREPPLILPL